MLSYKSHNFFVELAEFSDGNLLAISFLQGGNFIHTSDAVVVRYFAQNIPIFTALRVPIMCDLNVKMRNFIWCVMQETATFFLNP